MISFEHYFYIFDILNDSEVMIFFLLKKFRTSGALWRGTGAVSRAGGLCPNRPGEPGGPVAASCTLCI